MTAASNSEARKRQADQAPTDTDCSLDVHVLAVTVRELTDELARVTGERDEARQAARQSESGAERIAAPSAATEETP